MATDNPTATTAPESEPACNRALDLVNEFDRKLKQAQGICDLICHARDIDGLIEDSAWAASELIEEGKKAADELWQLYRAREWPEAPKAVQS
jgi:hypothetical protein